MLQFQLVNLGERNIFHGSGCPMSLMTICELRSLWDASRIKLNEAIHVCKVLCPMSSTERAVLQKQERSLVFIIQQAFLYRLKLA